MTLYMQFDSSGHEGYRYGRLTVLVNPENPDFLLTRRHVDEEWAKFYFEFRNEFEPKGDGLKVTHGK